MLCQQSWEQYIRTKEKHDYSTIVQKLYTHDTLTLNISSIHTCNKASTLHCDNTNNCITSPNIGTSPFNQCE